VSSASDTMDVSSLEAVVALAISPFITSPPATDATGRSDCDHRDQGRDETTTPVEILYSSFSVVSTLTDTRSIGKIQNIRRRRRSDFTFVSHYI